VFDLTLTDRPPCGAATNHVREDVPMARKKAVKGLGFLDLVAKLEELKSFVTGTVPMALDQFAEVCDKAGDALRNAADFLRGGKPDLKFETAEDVDALGRLEAIRAELEAPVSRAGGWEWLVPIILEIVKRILDRRRQEPAPAA
jgi:hypothetical protein